jgi:dimethylglycine dehydrogenase
MRWFDSSTRLRTACGRERLGPRTGFQIAGPRARDVLQACTRRGCVGHALHGRARMTIGLTDCIVQRVSYTGDLGYEIYAIRWSSARLVDALGRPGQPHGMKPFGMRAMMSLRLDKFFGSWMREFSPDYTAAETGLDRFIAFKKNVDFIGRAAAEAERARPARKLCNFEVEADDADVHGL